MHLPFRSYDNYIPYFSFMQNLFLRVFSLFHFSIFQTSVPWLVVRVAATGIYPPRFERKRIGWNKTLLSMWLT